MIRSLLLSTFLFGINALASFAQHKHGVKAEYQNVKFSDIVVQSILDPDTDTIFFNNYNVEIDAATAEGMRAIVQKKLENKSVARQYVNAQGYYNINNPLVFYQCIFFTSTDADLQIEQLEFDTPVIFTGDAEAEGCEIISAAGNHLNGLIFKHCNFKAGIQLEGFSATSLLFDRCKIGDKLEVRPREVSNVRLHKCEYENNIELKAAKDFDNKKRLIYRSSIDFDNEKYGEKPCTLTIEECKFYTKYQGYKLDLTGKYKILHLEDNLFDISLDFDGAEVEDNFINTGNIYKKYIDFNGCVMPGNPSNIVFHWSQLEGFKLAVFDDSEDDENPRGELVPSAILYHAKDRAELAEWPLYEELINSYFNLLTTYKGRGDLESGNHCYIEMKNMETRRLWYIYQKTPNLYNYFKYQINYFLQYFCDYGTNPVKSVLYSFYVILYFAIFYFIFPSEKDNLYLSRLSPVTAWFSGFFSSKQHDVALGLALQRFVTTRYKETLKTMRIQFGKYPYALRVLGKPLYNLSIMVRSFNYWVVVKQRLIPGEWSKKTRLQQIWGSVQIISFFSIYLLLGLVARIINAATLSVNAFVTLGYGEITAVGMSRYLAVVEGLVGWFLLSIFSVSLISQILQS
ncbi:MAG TPA: hypothetical protein DCM08_00480 [Microscillaceae bacterium]|nr:hypothetical protein [Microscillaceae bacterium]